MSLMVAIEGIDASGKATHSKLLAREIKGSRLSFPDYETATGKLIRSHLENRWRAFKCFDGAPVSPENNALMFQCLQTVNRLELLPTILEAVGNGPVVFDRYWASGAVYGVLEGLDPEWLESIHSHLPQPDIWVFLDISVDESFRRRPDRRDRYEEDRQFLEKVRVAYLRLFQRKGWYVVNGNGTVEEVHERIMKVVNGI